MVMSIIILFWWKKNTKLVKRIKNNYLRTKTSENPNVVNIKLLIIEHPKNSHKLSKTIRQVGNDSLAGSGKTSNSSLCRDTKK